jgi:hypothetical protein
VRWGTTDVGLGMETADGRTVTGHAHRADRLLIRPASGRQADTGLSARTHHWKDTATAGHSKIESRPKSTDANLTNAPDGDTRTLTVRECHMSDDCSAVAIVSHAGHFGPSPESQASNVNQFPSTPHAVTPVATSGTNRVTEPQAAQCA